MGFILFCFVKEVSSMATVINDVSSFLIKKTNVKKEPQNTRRI